MRKELHFLILLVFVTVPWVAVPLIKSPTEMVKEKAEEYGMIASVGGTSLSFSGVEIYDTTFSSDGVEIVVESIKSDFWRTDIQIKNVKIEAISFANLLAIKKNKPTVGNDSNGGKIERKITVSEIDARIGGAVITGGEIQHDSEETIAKAETISAIFRGYEFHIDSSYFSTKHKGIKIGFLYVWKAKETAKEVSFNTSAKIKKLLPSRGDLSMFVEYGQFEDSVKAKNSSIVAKIAGESITLSGSVQTLEKEGVGSINDMKIDLKKRFKVFSLDMHGDSFTARNEAITKTKIESGKFRVKISGEFKNKNEYEIKEGSIQLGGPELSAKFGMAVEKESMTWHLETPEVQCKDIIKHTPKSIIPKLDGSTVKGTAYLMMSGEINNGDPKVSMKAKNGCVMTKVSPDLSIEKFRSPFVHEVYGAGNQKIKIYAGPGSTNWTHFSGISKYMKLAVLTTEDPGFYGHRGMSYKAIQNSIEANIKAKKFVRGASTISMQLAKNLWLMREKTLSRKIQEAFLVTYLEHSMNKDSIFELYLNIVEFGPNIYGIREAARHYFRTIPEHLTLSQSVFLASILPRPKSIYFDAKGTLSARRENYVKMIIGLMESKGLITKKEMEEGLAESVKFGDHGIVAPELSHSEDGIGKEEWN